MEQKFTADAYLIRAWIKSINELHNEQKKQPQPLPRRFWSIQILSQLLKPF